MGGPTAPGPGARPAEREGRGRPGGPGPEALTERPPGISWHVQLSVCGFAGLNQGASVRPQPASSGQGPGSQDQHPGEARG